MKNIKLLILLFALSANFYSCEEEKDYGNPTIEFKTDAQYVQDAAALEAGENGTIGIKAMFNTNDNITNFKVILVTDIETTVLDQGINQSEIDYDFDFTKGLAETETYIFRVTDIKGHSAEISLTITKAEAQFGEINSYSGITLGAQNSTTGHFYSLSNNTVYTSTTVVGNEGLIDIIYFIGKSNQTLGSPAISSEGEILGVNTWSIKKETFYSLTTDISDTQFSEIQNDEILLNAASIGTDFWKSKVKDAAVGQYYYIKTQDSKFGLLRITDVQGTDAGTVTFEVKIQK